MLGRFDRMSQEINEEIETESTETNVMEITMKKMKIFKVKMNRQFFLDYLHNLKWMIVFDCVYRHLDRDQLWFVPGIDLNYKIRFRRMKNIWINL